MYRVTGTYAKFVFVNIQNEQPVVVSGNYEVTDLRGRVIQIVDLVPIDRFGQQRDLRSGRLLLREVNVKDVHEKLRLEVVDVAHINNQIEI